MGIFQNQLSLHDKVRDGQLNINMQSRNLDDAGIENWCCSVARCSSTFCSVQFCQLFCQLEIDQIPEVLIVKEDRSCGARNFDHGSLVLGLG